MMQPASAPSERLFIGNLAPQVDEYALLQLFRKHGKIASLDFPFHRHGPLKGKPRGFAFVQYQTTTQALKAILELHDKMLRGRKMVVRPANEVQLLQAPFDRLSDWVQAPDSSAQAADFPKQKGRQTDEDKIEALERKLDSMRDEPSLSKDASLPAKPRE